MTKNENLIKAFEAFLSDFKSEVIKEVFNYIKSELEAKEMRKKKYYNIKELAQITSISHRALKARIKRGTLNATREGNIYLIPVDEVNRLLLKLKKGL